MNKKNLISGTVSPGSAGRRSRCAIMACARSASGSRRLASKPASCRAQIATDPEIAQAWIPGVEIFARTIHPQRHRGLFGEFARRDEGPLARIGLWPQQWSAARMFAQTAKGFHIHPPSVPEGHFA